MKMMTSSTPEHGCSDRELKEIEDSQGTGLPIAYSELMKQVGRVIGRPEQGEFMAYPDVLDFKAHMRKTLMEYEADFTLPEDALVFSAYQGYSFLFVCSSEGPDPPVYNYSVDQNAPRRAYASFSEFIRLELMSLL